MKLKQKDPKIYNLIKVEEKRQNETLQLIPSENRASEAVREALGSVLTNKYSEGYPGKRYYQGNKIVDELETLAIERAKKLFKVPHANVQPYSGSPANLAVYFATIMPGETIMGLDLTSGGHLTHGHPKVNISGKYFDSVQYSVGKDGYLNYKDIEKLAKKFKPRVIISGGTAYPRILDFKKLGMIADDIEAFLVADISHIAGLVAAKVHPSPVQHCHIVTTTTHKTLRGPRGAMIMVTDKGLKKDAELGVLIDKAVFPGIQGGPHNNQIAALAVCLQEASEPSFTKYAKQVVKNAKTLARELKKHGFTLVSGGTDTHLILIDLTNKKLDGWQLAWALENAGIIANKNTIPGEKNSPFYPSGLRLGTPYITTMGMKEKEMVKIANWIDEVADIAKSITETDKKLYKEALRKNEDLKDIAEEVKKLCLRFCKKLRW
jgi:glycine hydroxymethyltransferase